MTRGVYRRVYSGFLKGRRINAVSIQAEAWFWRLHAVADDFGNFHADPVLLMAEAAPLRRVTRKQAERWLGELVETKLVKLYEVEGERYGHIIDFIEMQPGNRNGKRVRRCPGEPGCIQVNPGESRCGAAPESESESEDNNNDNSESESEDQGQASDSPKRARDGSSGSDSGSLSRAQAKVRYDAEIVRLLGLREGCRLARDDPGAQADVTCARRIWEDVWPPDGDSDECQKRFRRLMELVTGARSKRKPLAWLQHRLKSEGLTLAAV